MIIGIDCSRITKENKTGVENYSKRLVLELSKIDKDNQYRLYLRPDFDPELLSLPKNFKLIVIKRSKMWTKIGLSLEMIKNKPEVLFVPSYTLPYFAPKKTVVTVHDLAWKYFPDAYSKDEIKIQEKALLRIINSNAKIIVYSDSTKKDLQHFYQLDEKRINFVPMGFDADEFTKFNRAENIVEEKYILSVGRLEEKKNTLGIIKAYKLLRKERKIQHKLVLAGKPGFGYEKIKSMIEKDRTLKNNVILLGFVDNNKLKNLYQNASALVFPSLYEGFGFPILEAFSFGVPVVTSNLSSMPEISGKAAIIVDPKKDYEIAFALSKIINKPDETKKMILSGYKIIKKYSWQETAKLTLRILLN